MSLHTFIGGLLVLLVYTSSVSNEYFTNTVSSSIKTSSNHLGNLNPLTLALVNKLNVSSATYNCINDIAYVVNAFKASETWAIKMFDSMQKSTSGLLYGNTYQMGNFDECVGVHHVRDPDPPIHGQFCLMHLEFKNSLGTKKLNRAAPFNSSALHLGFCFPSSCSREDAAALVKRALPQEFGGVFIGDKDCYFERDAITFSLGEIIYCTLIALCALFILVATLLHMFHIKTCTNVLQYNIHNMEDIRRRTVPLGKRVILCFSLIANIKKLMHVKPTELNLECISGIKFLSMQFILFGHSLMFIFGSPLTNSYFIKNLSVKVENSVFLNNALLVDSFLLVGGFLLCRLLLIELDKRRGKINLFILYIARYVRLTPSYAVILGLYLTLLPRLGSGPLWRSVTETERDRCRESWWTNLLYVNNFVHTDKLCMFQAWYLAVDYHLFIVSPLLIYSLWRWPKVGFAFASSVTLFAAILPAYITYKEKLDPTLLAFPTEINDLSTNYYFTTAYIKTYMRASSYFLGLLYGYAVHKVQKDCIKIPALTLWMSWIVAVTFLLTSMCSIVLFLRPDYVYDNLQSALYASLHRVAWASAVGWVILVCVTDNAGPVNKFLSWSFFVPLSRLTYCAYLVNGLVLICYKGMLREAVSWTKFSLTCALFGHLVLTMMLAMVLCVCFESPIHGLEKILLQKEKAVSRSIEPRSMLRRAVSNNNKIQRL